MGKTFAMSGIIDWLKVASSRKMSAKMIAKDTKESIQEKIRALKKTNKEMLERSEE